MLTSRRHVRLILRIKVAAILFALLVAAGACARAAELAEQAHSLRVVPADAAFYSASLRFKEQLDIFLESKAYQRLMEIPLIQIAKGQITFQWQQATFPQVAQAKQYIESPEGKDAVGVLADMFSNEMFVYGSNDIASLLELFMDMNSISRQARLEAVTRGESAEEAVSQRVIEAIEKQVEKLKIPTVVLGWRIEDADRAERELDVIHSLVRNLLDEHRPELAAHLQRDQIGGHEFLTLRLDGSMIPWDQIREESEVDDEQIEKWQKLLNDKSLAVALGVTDEFVLLSLGESTEHLETFGKGKSLSEQPALDPIKKHSEERLTSIGYLSKQLATTMSSPERTIEDLAGVAEEVLLAAKVGEEQRKELLDDLRGLGGEFKKYMPSPGDVASVSFLTSRGYEGFKYQSGVQPMLDSSKPLTVINHLGGKPLLFVAARSKESPEDYNRTVEWVKQIGVKIEKIVESKVEADEWAKYLKYREKGIALLERLDKTNREHLIPALADGQSAFVLDTAAKSPRWFKQMPESPKPLPMLEVAVIASVSNAEHLRTGMSELFDIVKDTIALAREIHPEEVPEFEVPEPEERDLDDGGTMFVYDLPEEWGIDKTVALNAGLTESVVAASWSPETTERLLKETPLDIDTKLDLKRPAAVITHFQFAKLINSLRPWIDYGFDIATGKIKMKAEDDDDEDGDEEVNAQQAALAMQMGFVMPQLQQFLEFTTALQSVSSVTYAEENMWITHSETHFQDLK